MPLAANESGVKRLRDAHLHLTLQSLGRITRQVFAVARRRGRPPCRGWTGGNPLVPGKANPHFVISAS